jgi:hypothetical protein
MLIIYNTPPNLEEKSSNPIQNMDQENQQYEWTKFLLFFISSITTTIFIVYVWLVFLLDRFPLSLRVNITPYNLLIQILFLQNLRKYLNFYIKESNLLGFFISILFLIIFLWDISFLFIWDLLRYHLPDFFDIVLHQDTAQLFVLNGNQFF